MRIPTRDAHLSMNLGQAVAVCLYELTRGAASATPGSAHAQAFPDAPQKAAPQPAAADEAAVRAALHAAPHAALHATQPSATAKELERLTQVWFEALCASGYVQSSGEPAALDKLRRMLRRLNFDSHDAEVWLGMMRQILWKTKHPEH